MKKVLVEYTAFLRSILSIDRFYIHFLFFKLNSYLFRLDFINDNLQKDLFYFKNLSIHFHNFT
jgi:hypothetical protein